MRLIHQSLVFAFSLSQTFAVHFYFQGSEKQYVATAKQRALTFLERMLPKIKNSYELAIVTYALALSKSADADLAYGRLLKDSKEEDGMVYWSPTPIKTNRLKMQQSKKTVDVNSSIIRVRYEFNRPFLEAKDYQDNDALAVEATAYALSTLFLMEGGGVTVLQVRIS